MSVSIHPSRGGGGFRDTCLCKYPSRGGGLGPIMGMYFIPNVRIGIKV